jgi:hypothetical protein
MRFPLSVTGNTLSEQARNEDIRNELGSYNTSGRFSKKWRAGLSTQQQWVKAEYLLWYESTDGEKEKNIKKEYLNEGSVTEYRPRNEVGDIDESLVSKL